MIKVSFHNWCPCNYQSAPFVCWLCTSTPGPISFVIAIDHIIEHYSLLSSRLTVPMLHMILNEWLYPFIASFLISAEDVYWQHYLVVTWLVPCETAASSAQVMFTYRSFTSYNHAPVHFIQSQTGSVHVFVCVCVCACVRACLAVTCHLHFWQNDRNLLLWGGTDTKIRVSTEKADLEKKILPPQLLQGLEPATSSSQILQSNHWAIPTTPLHQTPKAHPPPWRQISSAGALWSPWCCPWQWSHQWGRSACPQSSRRADQISWPRPASAVWMWAGWRCDPRRCSCTARLCMECQAGKKEKKQDIINMNDLPLPLQQKPSLESFKCN